MKMMDILYVFFRCISIFSNVFSVIYFYEGDMVNAAASFIVAMIYFWIAKKVSQVTIPKRKEGA